LKLFEIGDFDLAFFAAGVAIFCRNGFFWTDLACLFFCGPPISVALFYEFWFGELKVDLFSVDL